FFAGVTLGALTLAIPHEPKDAVTGAFQRARALMIDARLRENTQTLGNALLDRAKFETILANRRSYREALATISWEKIHRAVAQKNSKSLVEEIGDFASLYVVELDVLTGLKAKAAGNSRSA
ncbi:MAG: hypothetical protein V4760_10995, partial [Bdellovibrionota bacterium]